MKRLSVLALAGFLSACSSSGTPPATSDTGCADVGCGPGPDGSASDTQATDGVTDSPPSDASAGDCTITLSGAQTGTFSCFASGSFQVADGVSAIAVTHAPRPAVAIEIAGELTARTYSTADSKGAGIWMTSGLAEWGATKDSETGDTVGSWTAVLETVTVTASTPDAKLYKIVGTVTADLPANNAEATGVVHLVATFR